jgi:FMN hydrolase / 5-amino-6-(5-phospho-D-ribitylamino)uracil phosphatase
MERTGDIVVKGSPGTNQMNKIKIISVDMFGTLANTDSIKYEVWREFLKDKYSDQLAETYWNRATEVLYKYYEKLACDRGHFYLTRKSFELAYAELFREIGLDFNPDEAAQILAHYHSVSALHNDGPSFLRAVREQYKVCLSSDADEDMLGTLRQSFEFDHVFSSEQLQCYKASNNGQFFTAIVDYYKVKPEEIIHIGDGKPETVNAKKAGLRTCWLNRKGSRWTENVKPDYEVQTLIDLIPILGANSGG